MSARFRPDSASMRSQEGAADLLFERLHSVRVGLQEIDVEHSAPLRLGGVVGGKHVLADAGKDSDVAAGLHLVILRADAGLLTRQHLQRILRIDEHSRPRSRTGLKVMIFTPRLAASCRGCRKRGLFVPGFWPKIEDRVAFREILEHAGPDGDADHLLERDGSRLVTHVGAVGEIVVAIEPREQRDRDRRLQLALPEE